MTNKPEDVLRDSNLKASIWKNDSERGAYFTTTITRTYEDKDGNLRDTHSLSKNDLLKAAELARGAYSRINELKREQNQSQESSLENIDRRAQFRDKRQLQSRKRSTRFHGE